MKITRQDVLTLTVCMVYVIAILTALWVYPREPEYSVGLKMRQTMNSLENGSQEASRSLSAAQVVNVLERADGDRETYSKELKKELKHTCKCEQHPGY